MKGSRKKIIGFAVAAVVVACGVWTYRWSCIPEYEVIDLGSLGGRYGGAMGINNFGEVAGWSEIEDGNDHAFIWDAKNGMRDLGTFNGQESYSHGINDKGQVVGRAKTIGGSTHAFLWDPNTGMTDLGTLGSERSIANGINNKGQIFGFSKNTDGVIHFIWDAKNGMKDIGTLGGGFTAALDINANGRIVGGASLPNGIVHAFQWDEANGMIDIADPNELNCEATGINDAGQVVGRVFKPEINRRVVFFWTKEKGMKELKILGVESYTLKINNSGQIIGRLRTKKILFFGGREFSFLRTRSGRIINLNRYANSKDEQITAININDHGWIVGQLSNSKKKLIRAILLRPK